MTEQSLKIGAQSIYIVVVLLLISASSALAFDLYVSVTGRDVLSSGIVNVCTTSSVPCRTINHTIEHSTPGDVIKVAIGEYNENIVLAPLVTFSLDIQGGWTQDFSERNIEQYYMKSMIRVSSGSAISIEVGGVDLDLSISGFIITGGNADAGGGIRFFSTSGGTKSINLYGNIIKDNQSNDNGGGLYIWDHSGDLSLTLSNNIITNNQTSGMGGGLLVYTVFPDATIEMVNNIFYDNRGGDGGGTFLYSTGAGTMSAGLTNNTLTENSATNNGGGLYVVALTNGDANVDIENTILWGNTAMGSGSDIHVRELDDWGEASTVVNARYSDIDDVGLYNGTYNDLGNNINKNPQLENASANDFHLMSVSPAINAGLCGEWINYGNLYAYNRIAPYTDFESDARCAGFATTGCCDIGADESPYSRMASQTMPWVPLLLLDD